MMLRNSARQARGLQPNHGSTVHLFAIAQILILLMLANGSPVIAKRLLGDRFSTPLDQGMKFIDGRPLFGGSKTIRGIVASIVVTSAGAPLLGLGIETGLVASTTAMAGDLLSSFIKRRLGLAPSSMAIGLDQIPESVLPLIACRDALSLTAVDILVAMAAFTVGDLLISRLLFRLRVRDRPF